MASSRDEVSRRRRVSFQQLEFLWEFLNSHREMAVGYNKSAQARDYSRRMWTSVSETLNSQGEGATKDWKGWSNYWVDYKAKLKRRVAALRTSQSRTGGGPSEVLPLNDLEKKFLSLLGEGFGTGLPNIQVDPFPALTQATDAVEPEAGPSHSENPLPHVPLLDHDFFMDEGLQHQDPLPLAFEEVPSPQQEVEAPSSQQEVPEEPQSCRNVQQRQRRRSARQGALSQQAARRILVDTARAKLIVEQQNSEILTRMAQSLLRNSQVLQEISYAFNRIAAVIERPTGSRRPETGNERTPDS